MRSGVVCKIKNKEDAVTLFSEKDLLEIIEESMGTDITNYLEEVFSKYKRDEHYMKTYIAELERELREYTP